MKQLYYLSGRRILSIITIAGASILAASASDSFINPSMLPKPLRETQHNREFRGQKPFGADSFTRQTRRSGSKIKLESIEPSLSFDDMPRYDYLEGPDGSTWFYTADYDFETVVHNPWWTEDMITGFTFTIYDSQFNEVGQIHDKIDFAPNETRAKEILLDAAVSSKFFNTDDKLEVMVYHVMNTEQYVNHYYYKVYSIDGEKDSEGNDVCVYTMEGRCADAINVGTSENEDFYFTFITDPVIDFKGDIPSQEYIDYLNTLSYTLTSYSKATADGGPTEVLKKDIYVTRIPGDTTDGIYFISKIENGNLYFIYSQYDKPYFVEPVLLNGDESATPDNSFIIETYSISNTPQLVSTTTIPIDYPDSSEYLRYAYYSIGSVAWTNDVDMSVNGTPSSPAYIVAHDIETVSTESLTSSYEIYDNQGNIVRTIATGTESIQLLTLPGIQPQIMFVKLDEQSEYQFLFANLYDGEELLTISQKNGGDPISASCSLVKDGEGALKYVFQLSDYTMDEDGTQYARVAWFNADGTLDHLDKVNMGANVQLAMVNLDPSGLNPYVYDDDEAMEYAVLVKRTYGAAGTTRNEFLVVDDSGKNFITFTADDNRGEPSLFTLLPGETNRIMMVYTSYYGFNVDLYDLPFELEDSSVAELTGNHSGIHYDGTTIYAADAEIEIFSTSGTRVAGGKDAVGTDSLQSGIYVVVATGSNGRNVIKISVK